MFRFLIDIPLGLMRSLTELFELLIQFLLNIAPEGHERSNRSWWVWLLLLPVLIPFWIVRGIFLVLAYPLVFSSLDAYRKKRFLYGVPSLVAFTVIVVCIIVAATSQNRTLSIYRNKMREAFDANQLTTARRIAERLISTRRENESDILFNYASILMRANETTRANEIIRDLAPDNRFVYAPAHRLRAMQYASEMATNPTESTLSKLHWHLENSGRTPDEQIEVLWALYYNTVKNESEATKHLENAARINPAHYLSLADMYSRSGNKFASDQAISQAESAMRKLLDANPMDKASRLQLALIKTRTGRIDEAEKLVNDGLALHDDPEMMRAASDFYLLRFDRGMSENLSFDKRFAFLQKALALDRNYLPAYDRIIALCVNSTDQAKRVEVKGLLEEMITDGKSPAMAHFALSSILLNEGEYDNAQFHLRQSFTQDPNMAVVSNNLAFLLANMAVPELDEAYELATQAVNQNPKMPDFRDTLGTVLMKQGRFVEAIAEFELALASISNKKPVHQKLAAIYEQMGQANLAKLHAEKAK